MVTPGEVVAIVLAITGILIFATHAANEVVDWRLGRVMTPAEYDEYQDYRAYLRTTWFGRDIEAWRALGRPERDRRP